MQQALGEVMGRVRGATENTDNASSEIDSGNLGLSQRTEQRAARLQEIASFLHQFTNAVQETGLGRQGQIARHSDRSIGGSGR